MRLLRCATVFDVKRFMDMYKDYSKKRVERIIEQDAT
jgi:hypothetical protein